MGQEPKNIIAVIYDGCVALDLTGPLEAFNYANLVRGEACYKITLTSDTAGPIKTMSDISLHATHTYSTIPEPIHNILIPGMRSGNYNYRSSGLIPWLKEVAGTSEKIASVCSGALILGEAGLLDNKRVTTHWMDSQELKTTTPEAHVLPDQIYVKDGQIYTSGGVTAGIDLALAMIEEDYDRSTALAVAKRMIVPLKRAGDQSQFSDLLVAQDKAKFFAELLDWIESNLQLSLNNHILATRIAMSERNFTRRFTQEIGLSPMLYVNNRRLEKAKKLLEETKDTVEAIAYICGFSSGESLSRSFSKHLKISPSSYRERFGLKH